MIGGIGMDEEKEMLPGDLEEEAVESGAVEENGKTKAPAWRPPAASPRHLAPACRGPRH